MNGLVAFIIQHAETLFQHVGMENTSQGSSSPRAAPLAAPSSPGRAADAMRLSMNPPSDPAPAPGPSSPRSPGSSATPMALTTSNGSTQYSPSSQPISPLAASGSSSSNRMPPPLPEMPASAISPRQATASTLGHGATSPRKMPPPVSPRNVANPLAVPPSNLPNSTPSHPLPTISADMENPALRQTAHSPVEAAPIGSSKS